MGFRFRVIVILAVTALLSIGTWAGTSNTTSTKTKPDGKVAESPRTKKRMARLRHSRRSLRKNVRLRRRYYERFYTSSFATDQTDGDRIDGEDQTVRQAAIDALGNMNGTFVAIDPTSGRILAMVNQKLALASGAQPCSTIKLSVALAALSENIIDSETEVSVNKHTQMTLTEALAKSNNAFFEALGRRLGFEKVSFYAHQFGLGELAGFNLAGEHLGIYPSHVLDAGHGGVGKMCSFGESISMTPLQLGALVSAIANGGTLYYLQHPNTPEEVLDFQPRVKRQLDISNVIPEMTSGMIGAVEYGTARSLHLNFSEEPVLGKTGTCSKDGTRFGWFASYAQTEYGHIVAVVFLQGGRSTFGPKAAEISGRFYRDLYDHKFFAQPAVSASTTDGKSSTGVPQ